MVGTIRSIPSTGTTRSLDVAKLFAMNNEYYFYLLRCSDDSLYAGISIDLEQRVEVHQNGNGAKYTRSRLPVTLVYHEHHRSKGDALRREAKVKKWTKQRKERLVRNVEESD